MSQRSSVHNNHIQDHDLFEMKRMIDRLLDLVKFFEIFHSLKIFWSKLDIFQNHCKTIFFNNLFFKEL